MELAQELQRTIEKVDAQQRTIRGLQESERRLQEEARKEREEVSRARQLLKAKEEELTMIQTAAQKPYVSHSLLRSL